MENRIRSIDRALKALAPHESECTLCPRMCRIDRKNRDSGICHTGSKARVSHALLHFGEEPVLSGCSTPDQNTARRGSGTIFFSGCNLKCLFCQNYQLSWQNEGRPVDDEELASMMLDLERQGALNINFVSPTHVLVPILRALRIAYEKGLGVPLVYNSNGYDRREIISLLDGIVDIYLPDFKYVSPVPSAKFSGAADYFEHCGPAVREMSLQQPVLSLDAEGHARKGLIVRHLVLPGFTADTLDILSWLKDNLSLWSGLSLMSQYHPCYKAPEEIQRALSPEEYRLTTKRALELGFKNVFLQPNPFSEDEHLFPDFDRNEPFKW